MKKQLLKTLGLSLLTITILNTTIQADNRLSEGKSKTSESKNKSPKYLDYPSNSIYIGKTASVILDNEYKKNFRTRLKNTSHYSINFAGEYVLTTWGCGTGCLSGAIVSKKTGKVFWLPGSVSSWEGEGDRLLFRKNSRLLIMAGIINEESKYGAHFYELTKSGFKHIKTIEIKKGKQ